MLLAVCLSLVVVAVVALAIRLVNRRLALAMYLLSVFVNIRNSNCCCGGGVETTERARNTQQKQWSSVWRSALHSGPKRRCPLDLDWARMIPLQIINEIKPELCNRI